MSSEVQYDQIIQAELNKSIKTQIIDVSNLQLDDYSALQIAYYLSECKHKIKALFLGSNNITDEGIQGISYSLRLHPELEELYVANNQFSRLGIGVLVNELSSLRNLQVLSIGNSQIHDAEATLLFCSCSQTLKRLYMSNNEIEDDGIYSLSVYLSNFETQLQTLHLGSNNFSSQALSSFLEAIQTNNTLINLFLNDNQLEEESIISLADFLRVNEKLQHLSLGNCDIDDEMLRKICSGLEENTTLQVLDLWSNQITDKGLEILLDLVENFNISLSQISLFGNKISDLNEQVQLLQDMLLQNQRFIEQNQEGQTQQNDPQEIKEECESEEEEEKELNKELEKVETFVWTGQEEEQGKIYSKFETKITEL